MNRKLSEKNVRKLMRAGKVTLLVSIPRDIILELGWKDNQKVVTKRQGKGILITDWSGKK